MELLYRIIQLTVLSSSFVLIFSHQVIFIVSYWVSRNINRFSLEQLVEYGNGKFIICEKKVCYSILIGNHCHYDIITITS